MPIRSMTGFATADAPVGQMTLNVEVRSVNHRGLDLKVTAPPGFSFMEPRILALIKTRIHRGRVDLRIKRQGPQGQSQVKTLDVALLKSYRDEIVAASGELGVVCDLHVRDLLVLPDVFVKQDTAVGDVWDDLEGLLTSALDGLIMERQREGHALADDLSTRIGAIGKWVASIEDEVPRAQANHLERLRERTAKMLLTLGGTTIPEERLAEEIVLYADRADVTEELTRAKTHARRLEALIDEHDPASTGIGKKLDFYFQELIREANTIASKSRSAEIAALVVNIRAEIDKLREQVLNIE